MQQDRSWVLPVAFGTFLGVVLGAVFLMLANQDLLLGPRATAVSGWLTLLVTAFGFGVTIYIVGMTAKQVIHSQKQTDLQELEVYTNRIAVLYDYIDLIKLSIKHSHSMRTISHDGTEDPNTPMNCELLVEVLEKIRIAARTDNHRDLTYCVDEFNKYTEEYVNLWFAASEIAKTKKINKNRKVINDEMIQNYFNNAMPFLKKINERRRIIEKKRRSISEKHFHIQGP